MKPDIFRIRQGGMSMIELLTVMTIIGILIVAVAPEITAQLRNAQIRNSADSMMAGLQRARTEAIRRNENVRFSLVDELTGSCVLSANSSNWVVSVLDPTGNCDTPASEETAPRIFAVHTAADGNPIAQVAATRADLTTAAASIVFNGFGRPRDGDQLARIIMKSPIDPGQYRTYRVDVSAAGGVRMCDLNATAADDPRRCPP